MSQTAGKQKSSAQGEIVAHKMNKTAVVKVVTRKSHPKYRKHFTVTKKYKAHDEKNEYQVGDTVEIESSRPISREKRWKIVKKIK
ncbi:MAG: 30S ribosomal protein S17 [Candidatus Doudnabacteria bacterium]|nr:30S ribosomal protein S17 [bacterium]MDZ4244137.1 30S ribosomal protein S17 [Candidatus Doudnabacteria bacterium]